jgi:capsule polysaccharide export protein KpsE/RkpR
MTKRTAHGYQHIHAYRTWLPEQEELLRVLALKGRDNTALKQTMSVEALSVCLGRSPSSIAKRAAELEVVLLTDEQLAAERARIEQDAADFVSRTL